MKVAILETGRPPGNLAETFGDYPAMFEQLLGPDFEIETFDVTVGQFPSDRHEAVLITGSPAGVYEDLSWIEPLEEFIRSAEGAKMIGICFGHQVMAEALGGRVEKSGKGWGAGLHRYQIVHAEPWIDRVAEIAVPASHQDQVMEQPPNTVVVARSNFTEFAGLAWTDRPAISFQFHPEFSPAFAKALIEKRYDIVPNPDAAIASLDAPNDNQRVGAWIRNFLRGDSQ